MARIGCKHCNFKGYVKHSFWNGEKEEVTVAVCSHCKDKRGYNLYVKQKYGSNNLMLLDNEESEAPVIDFESYKKDKKIIHLKSDLSKKE